MHHRRRGANITAAPVFAVFVLLLIASIGAELTEPDSTTAEDIWIAPAGWAEAVAAMQATVAAGRCRIVGGCKRASTPAPRQSPPPNNINISTPDGVSSSPMAANVTANASGDVSTVPVPPAPRPPVPLLPSPLTSPAAPDPNAPAPSVPAPPPPPLFLDLTVLPRLEIRDFIEDSLSVDLLLLSMASLQAKPASDPSSYFALAAIHGEPYVAYRGIVNAGHPWTAAQVTKRWGGYCTHGSTLFPTWHRPYMALFEQALMTEALDIAQQYPDNKRDAYIAAARRFRMPYWDWANDDSVHSGMPSMLRDPVRTVHHPTKGTISIKNPLAGYTLVADVDGPGSKHRFPLFMRKGQTTARWPSPSDSVPKTHNANLLPNIQGAAKQWQQQLLNVLINPSWKCFSNNAAWVANRVQPTAECPLISLEGLHDQIHALGGGTQGKAPDQLFGTLSLLEVAAFDPLFFFHHANVDRILSLWQTLHPKSFVATGPNSMGSYTDPPGGSVNNRSPLTPFRPGEPWTAADAARQATGHANPDPSKAFYTSLDVQNPEKFGYTYAELRGNPSPERLWGQLHSKYHGKSGMHWHLTMEAIPMHHVRPGFAIQVSVLPHPSRRRRAAEVSAPSKASPEASAAAFESAGDDAPLFAGAMHFFASGAGFGANMTHVGVRATVDLTHALEAQGYGINWQGSSDTDAAAPTRAAFSLSDLHIQATNPRDAKVVEELLRSSAYIAYHQCDPPQVSVGGSSSSSTPADGRDGGRNGVRVSIGTFAADGVTRISHSSSPMSGE